MTIIDPRHALYGQKLRLVNVASSRQVDAAVCTVELRGDIWRRIPLGVTDLAENPPVSYPLALNLTVLGELLTLFRRLEVQSQEVTGHEKEEQARNHSPAKRQRRTKAVTPPSVATTRPPTTSEHCPDTDANLWAACPGEPVGKGGGSC